jgi:hypothetical protein
LVDLSWTLVLDRRSGEGRRTHMSDIAQAQRALLTRILEGDGEASQAQRRAAFVNAGLSGPLGTLIEKVVRRAYRITDEDVAAVESSGFREDPIFELVVCAAVGQASRQHDVALAALDAASRRDGNAASDSR